MPLPLLGLLAASSSLAGQTQIMMQLYPPLWNAYQKKALASWPNVNPSIAETISAYHRGLLSDTDYTRLMSESGIDAINANILFDASKDLLTAADYVMLWRRGIITEVECDNKLIEIKYDTQTISHIKAATVYFPSAQDLVRFAVRDVYTPVVMQKFGLLEDLPPKYISESAKTGLDAEQAKNYWAAHWELPSAGQGFEMFQRRVIDQPTLELLLKSLDVMPYWRDKLIQISYNPLTRVDVRRMYNLGVLSEDEVYNSYLDGGYSPENARRMTDFTVLFEDDETKGITRATLDNAYKNNLISLEQYKEYLSALKYSDRTVDLYVSQVEYEKKDSEVKALEKEVKNQYKAGLITLEDARKLLESADLPSNYVTSIITSMMKAKSDKLRQPEKGDLIAWLKSNTINHETFITRMLKLGYTREDTEYYLTDITKATPTDTVKYLSFTQYQKWAKTGLLTPERYKYILTQLKLSQQDIDMALAELSQTQEAVG